MKKELEVDMVVLGAGPGGYTAAFLAADHGLRVALVDPNAAPGGVCLHRGCIPTKALLHIAKTKQEASHLSDYGVSFAPPEIDVDQLRKWKQEVVKKLTMGLTQLSKARNIVYIQGYGKFEASDTLCVVDKDKLEWRVKYTSAIVATGSAHKHLAQLDYTSDRVWDAQKALELPSIPSRLLLIGGGYIGLEMGYIYQSLGAQTTIVEASATLMPNMDTELTRIFENENKDFFFAIKKGTQLLNVEESESGLIVTLENKQREQSEELYDTIIVAIGQEPLSNGCDLENTLVQVDSRGFIQVNKQQCTTDDKIYAIGDVTGGAMLAHKASYEARIAVEAILGEKSEFDAKVIPAVVYTEPELATVGLTEAEAKDLGIAYHIAKFPWAASGRAIAMGSSSGLTKLIIDKESERILGAAIVGKNAGDMISELTLAIEMGATASDIELTIHPHPTLSETIMETAGVFYGNATHLFQKTR